MSSYELIERTNAGSMQSITEFSKISKLGRGGFANVYLFRENKTGKEYAIKECYKQSLVNTGTTHFVMRERRILSRLNHRFIIKLHAAFQDKFVLYFVLDYMPGGSLADQSQKWHHFRNEVTRFYGAEIILALEYLRSEGCVHRDLKSDNILLDAKGHIKVTDFGTCVQLDYPEAAQSRRNMLRAKRHRTNSTAGTRIYFAPEIMNNSDVTYATDLWCLGCMLFEFHTGHYAFPETFPDLDGRINAGSHTPFPKGYDPDLKDLVDKLLVPDPSRRIGYECMDDIKHHPFFGTEDVEDWNLIHTLKPPPFDPWHDRARFGEAERQPQHPALHKVEKDNNPFCGINLSKKCPAFKDPPQFLDWETMEEENSGCCMPCNIL